MQSNQGRAYVPTHSMRIFTMPGTKEIVQEETVAEIKLVDMACHIAAPDATPLTAILAIPRRKEVLWIASDASSE
jgi:hypothetical protein